MNTILSFVLSALSHAHSTGEVVVEDVVSVVQDAEQVRSLEPGAAVALAPFGVHEFGNDYRIILTVERANTDGSFADGKKTIVQGAH